MICSITKSFTATAIALLHHVGRLDWSKPVRDYMPEFRLSDAVATERVMVRDLLCRQWDCRATTGCILSEIARPPK